MNAVKIRTSFTRRREASNRAAECRLGDTACDLPRIIDDYETGETARTAIATLAA